MTSEERAQQEPLADDLKLSDKLTSFVNILFGVVIGQSVSRYSDLIFHPSWTLPWIALLILYVIVILSWIGYHRALLTYPYRIIPYPGVRGLLRYFLGFLRLVTDVAIVGIYAFLLFEIQAVKDGGPSPTLNRYLLGFFMIYVLYLLFVILRWVDYRNDERAKNWKGPALFALVFLAVLVTYRLLETRILAETIAWLNWIYLFIVFIGTVTYRALRR